MLMVVFRSSLKERVYELLQTCGVLRTRYFLKRLEQDNRAGGREFILCWGKQCDPGLARTSST
jgi:hypothetical protein